MSPFQSSIILSPFDILRLVGFATGAALHLYLFLVLYGRYGLRRSEPSLLGLGLSIGLWHLGNFASAIHGVLDVSGGEWWLKLSDAVAYSALAFLPPTLAHAHFRAWGWFEDGAPRGAFRLLVAAGYLPLALLPWAAAGIVRGPYGPPAEKLSVLLVPFILWIVFIMIECALIDVRLAGVVEPAREKRFFKVFGATLAGIGALFTLTYLLGGRSWRGIGRYLELAAMLSSIGPTAIIAYYIYRYRYLELVIRQSFVYAALAAAVMIVYIFGIRRLSLVLAGRYGLRAEALEALMILGLIFLSGPLRRVTENYLQGLFAREIGHYRELVTQLGDAASSYSDLDQYLEFAEKRLSEGLELDEVRLLTGGALAGWAGRACELAEERRLAEIEDRGLLAGMGVLACYPLWREGRVIGLMTVGGAGRSLTAEKREVLAVLAGQVAVAIEKCRLLGEKLKLERELAERDRLAALGQMAATVAHEVKNPLSAIKSIAQVMREDEEVSREYGRDLDLIAGEVDRLNRTVSQLLSFSRPSAVASAPSDLRGVIDDVLALNRPGLEGRNVRFELDLPANPVLGAATVAALREILMNLVLNAVQAVPGDSGLVTIAARTEDGGKILHVSVTDDGVGIPAAIRERVFEPFFTTRQRGTGLGLQIVMRRVRDLGGRIELTSPVEAGRGTRFDLFIDISGNGRHENTDR